MKEIGAAPLTTVEMGPEAIDTLALRRALGRFATGVTVVTTQTAEGGLVGVTANSFSSVSLDPPLVLWSIRRNARSLPAFIESRQFAINVLASGQQELAHRFSAVAGDRFSGTTCREGAYGCPLIEGSLAHFECALETTMEGGDHVILLGRVLKAGYRDGDPLVFSSGAYCTTRGLGLNAAAE